MEKNEINKSLWRIAGTEGLKLGLISAAYMFATLLLEKTGMPVLLNSLLSFVLWVAKFAGCILLMKIAMVKFAKTDSKITNRDTFMMGMATALLSAFVFSVISYVNVAFISADLFAEQFDTLMQQMAPMMDSNSLNLMDSYLENLPEITFFSNLIYCFLFGTVLSAILSRNIPARDPFADYKPDEQ